MSYMATSQRRRSLPPLVVGDRRLSFGQRAYVMGVVNVTPDSFSDGGHFFDEGQAVEHALELWEAGADILDIGGESTRPGAEPVTAAQEMERVVPVIEKISQHCDAWISVDTYKADVARAAVEAGADLVNDISGLGFDEAMGPTVADLQCGLVLMHIRKTPKTMQDQVAYDELIGDIRTYFEARLQRAVEAGIDPSRVLLDPGIGFGKTVAHNYRLIRDLSSFADLGHPLLVGTSRKSFIGAVLDRPPHQRVWGTAATVACAILTGADIVRVHDVEEMVQVTRIAEAICAMDGAEISR